MNRFTNLILTLSLFASNAKAFDMAECKKKAIAIATQEVQKAANVVGVVELEDSSQAIGPYATTSYFEPFVIFDFTGKFTYLNQVRNFTVHFGVDPDAGCELKVPFRFSPNVIWK